MLKMKKKYSFTELRNRCSGNTCKKKFIFFGPNALSFSAWKLYHICLAIYNPNYPTKDIFITLNLGAVYVTLSTFFDVDYASI